MKKFYQGLNGFSKVFFWTFSFHLFLVFSFTVHHLFIASEPKKKIKVYQMPLKAEKKVFQQESVVPSPQLAKNPEKKGLTKVQKSLVKSAAITASKVSKKVESKKVDSKKVEPKKVDSALLSKIQNECKQIEKTNLEIKKQSVAAIAIPTLETKTSVESSEVFTESSDFGEKLLTFLQATLELPEFGQVKVFLEINTLGKVSKVDVLESKSKKNAQVLKNQLLDLDVSGLNDNRPLPKNYEYTITFKNNENIF